MLSLSWLLFVIVASLHGHKNSKAFDIVQNFSNGMNIVWIACSLSTLCLVGPFCVQEHRRHLCVFWVFASVNLSDIEQLYGFRYVVLWSTDVVLFISCKKNYLSILSEYLHCTHSNWRVINKRGYLIAVEMKESHNRNDTILYFQTPVKHKNICPLPLPFKKWAFFVNCVYFGVAKIMWVSLFILVFSYPKLEILACLTLLLKSNSFISYSRYILYLILKIGTFFKATKTTQIEYFLLSTLPAPSCTYCIPIRRHLANS